MKRKIKKLRFPDVRMRRPEKLGYMPDQVSKQQYQEILKMSKEKQERLLKGGVQPKKRFRPFATGGVPFIPTPPSSVKSFSKRKTNNINDMFLELLKTQKREFYEQAKDESPYNQINQRLEQFVEQNENKIKNFIDDAKSQLSSFEKQSEIKEEKLIRTPEGLAMSSQIDKISQSPMETETIADFMRQEEVDQEILDKIDNLKSQIQMARKQQEVLKETQFENIQDLKQDIQEKTKSTEENIKKEIRRMIDKNKNFVERPTLESLIKVQEQEVQTEKIPQREKMIGTEEVEKEEKGVSADVEFEKWKKDFDEYLEEKKRLSSLKEAIDKIKNDLLEKRRIVISKVLLNKRINNLRELIKKDNNLKDFIKPILGKSTQMTKKETDNFYENELPIIKNQISSIIDNYEIDLKKNKELKERIDEIAKKKNYKKSVRFF